MRMIDPFSGLRQFWTGSLRRRWAISVAAMTALLLLAFVYMLMQRQQDFLALQNEKSAISLAKALASSSTPWVISNDLAGLREIVDATADYPDLIYVMILTPQGQVLAHSAGQNLGSYVKDAVSQDLLTGPRETRVVVRTPALLDIASPIQVGAQVVGWARVGMGQESVTKSLASLRHGAWWLGALAVVLSVLLTWGLTSNLARGLAQLVALADAIGRGGSRVRFAATQQDELGALGQAFDRMSADLERADQQLMESLHEVTDLYNNAPCGYHSVGPDGRIMRINDTELSWLGYTRDELVGKYSVRDLLTPSSQRVFDDVFPLFKEHGVVQGAEYEMLRKDGSSFYVLLNATAVRNPAGEIVMSRSTLYDITQRKSDEKKMERLALYDTLTQLPNRRLFMERLQNAQMETGQARASIAVLFIDMDHFKRLNEVMGHSAGDAVLCEVAVRILACIREGDTLARLGADEFAVVLRGLQLEAANAALEAQTIAQNIGASLQEPFKVFDSEYEIGCSMGISICSGTQVSAQDLLKQADLAMGQAKLAGPNGLRFYDPDMEEAVAGMARLESDLKQALKLDQLMMYYQPQVDALGTITGAEMLLRWQHPLHGMVSPARFIPLAEETRLIVPIGEWVLHTACAQLALWAKSPATEKLTLAVNVSAHQFLHPRFSDHVAHALQLAGANPRRLKLELTESVLVYGVDDIVGKMSELKALGVSFSLDDFGTGYSSLSYLKRLPLDQLKIDQSFVRDVLTDPNDASIARTIVALAHSMGLQVIAEGVETTAQREFLLNIDCSAYQGYLFGRPMPIHEFERLLDPVTTGAGA